MKPLKFKGHNCIFAKDQEEYQQLPALRVKGSEGNVITCWKLSTRDRWKLLFTGKLWVSKLTFNQPLQPIYLQVDTPESVKEELIKLNNKTDETNSLLS